jgi:hypothetical protein
MMSRNPVRSKRPQQTGSRSDNQGHPADGAIIEQAHALYGSEAPTVIAYCGLEAWFEGEEAEFRRFARLFRRLIN